MKSFGQFVRTRKRQQLTLRGFGATGLIRNQSKLERDLLPAPKSKEALRRWPAAWA
jgi:hypothetical protein